MTGLTPSRRNVIAIRPKVAIPNQNRPEDIAAIEHRQKVAAIGAEVRPDAVDQLDEVLRTIGKLPCHKLRCLTNSTARTDVFIMYFRAKVALAEFEAVEAQATIAVHEGTYGEHGGPWSIRRDEAARAKNLAVEACLRTPATTLAQIRTYKASLARAASLFGERGYWEELIAADEARLRAMASRRRSASN